MVCTEGINRTIYEHGSVPLTKCYSGDQIKGTRCGDMEHVSGEERRGAYRFLVGKHEGEIPLRSFRRSLEDNVK